jgi:formylglycine-generating enzyme required for sulfatase activity
MQPAPDFVNSLGLKMIRVGAAAFDAWTPSFADAETVAVEVSGGLERPPLPHRVELPGDFYLAEVPVTNALYRRFVAETGHRTPGGELFDIDRVKTGKGFSGVILVSEGVETWERDGFTADDQPVAGVNYVDAVAFCAWLSAAEGRTYRLPEAYEWEYACRAGTETLFWWGDRPDPRSMNYAASRIGHPTPVGFYPPSPWGFHDLHGNVAECCEQIGRPGGVQKGAAWNYPATLTGADIYVDVRGTFTPHMPITRRTLEIGFRVCCDADQAPAPGSAEGRQIVLAGGTGPDLPELEITLGEKLDFGTTGNQIHSFLVTRSGRWLMNDRRSDDRGATWEPCTMLAFNALQLRDGTIIQCTGPGARSSGWDFEGMSGGFGAMKVTVSTDDWQTVSTFDAPIEIPLGVQFGSDAAIVELDDGTLLMGLYGWMDGDQVREDNPMFPIVDGAYKTRVIAVVSKDRGRSWRYLSTICYHPEMGREGANETTIIKLPSGDLFAAMRTGLHGYSDRHGREHLDEPLLCAWSRCDGRSWSEPARIYVRDRLVTGIWPRSVLTSEGVLAVLRARPDGSVIFCPDGTGTIWTDEVVYRTGRVGGSMDGMALIGPDTLLAVYVDEITTQGDERIGHVSALPVTVRRKG